MADCNFRFDFEGNASSVIDMAREAIRSAGGQFNGDDHEGSFSLSLIGTLSGSYRVDNAALHINIDNKPMLLSCSRIEKELRKYLSNGV